MCGLAGWLGILPKRESYAQTLVDALRHRGPDGKGIQSWPHATLVHTRLSIIDLSQAGAQPLANERGTIWTVFNGEIYNHREIRSDLEAKGHILKGRSDSEILPHLYEEEGWEFVKHLRGMFALAIYDTQTRTLVLARDRFGIKPLFYVMGKDFLAFSSEIRALRMLPGIDLQPDRQAIYDFAALSYIPAPETFFRGIRAIQPGEVLVGHMDGERVTYDLRHHHQWAITPNPLLNISEAADTAEELIRIAVRRQMESDVPLGSLLSGGIDSSLVSFAAQEALQGGLQTFNVRFQDEAFDETWAAVAMANHIESHHQILDMKDNQGSWSNVTRLLLHAGQPFADTSIFAVHEICRLLRQFVKVALSGDGGDEGFGGYNTYSYLMRIVQGQIIPPLLWQGAAKFLESFSNSAKSEWWARQIRTLTGADDISIVQYLFCWIREEEHKNLCRDKHLLPIRRLFEPKWEYRFSSRSSRLERLSAHVTEINVRLKLTNDFLFKVDTASMRQSLEIRVPMLDEDLFDFGLTLPHNLKANSRVCKRVLREVSKRCLPLQVANKPKMGFGIPVDKWVDSDFKCKLKESLLGPSSCLPEYFHPEVYRPMIEAFCAGRSLPGVSREGLYQRVIMMLAVDLAHEGRAA